MKLFLSLALLFALSIRASAAPDPLPAVIAGNTTAMVLYHSGRVEANGDMQAFREIGTLGYSLRYYARTARAHMDLFRNISIFAWAYFLGRVNAFEEAADLAGEPD